MTPVKKLPLEKNTYRRRLGLLGGSFNPPHTGHREISLAALERLNLDVVWWLVTPGNPLKDSTVYAPFDERLRRARAFADHCDIVVSDFERRHNLQYTVDTIERLQLLNPTVQFIWLMGADSLASFDQWKDWKRISELVSIAVFNRPGYTQNALDSAAATALKAFRIDELEPELLLESEPPAWIYFSDTDNSMSSTALRDGENQ